MAIGIPPPLLLNIAPTWSFVIGLFVGATIGVLVAALAAAAHRGDL